MDLNEMEQLLNQEISDFENNNAPVLNVLSVIKQREACLAKCVELSKQLGDLPEDQREETLEQLDEHLKELR